MKPQFQHNFDVSTTTAVVSTSTDVNSTRLLFVLASAGFVHIYFPRVELHPGSGEFGKGHLPVKVLAKQCSVSTETIPPCECP